MPPPRLATHHRHSGQVVWGHPTRGLRPKARSALRIDQLGLSRSDPLYRVPFRIVPPKVATVHLGPCSAWCAPTCAARTSQQLRSHRRAAAGPPGHRAMAPWCWDGPACRRSRGSGRPGVGNRPQPHRPTDLCAPEWPSRPWAPGARRTSSGAQRLLAIEVEAQPTDVQPSISAVRERKPAASLADADSPAKSRHMCCRGSPSLDRESAGDSPLRPGRHTARSAHASR
jgi:hypothetical protein